MAFNPWLTTFSHRTKGLNMRQIKIGLKDVPLSKRIQMGRQIVASLTDNPNFPNVGPWRDLLLAATDELEASYTDAQLARQITASKISLQHAKAKAFNLVMTQVASNIANVSGLVPQKVLSAGFDLCKPNTALGALATPVGLTALSGEHSGTMELYWNKVRGAKSYMIEYALAGEGGAAGDWITAACCTKISVLVKSLVSGRKYWFRVAAIGTAGQSAWSTPVAKFAL